MIQTLIVTAAACAMAGTKRRVALAMLFGDVGSMLLLPPLSLPDHVWVIGMYIMLDLTSAAIVLQRPIGKMQQAIGLLFATMVMFHIGFLTSLMLSTRAPSTGVYWEAQVFVGWTQLGLLISWGVFDVVRAVLGVDRSDRRTLYRATSVQ